MAFIKRSADIPPPDVAKCRLHTQWGSQESHVETDSIRFHNFVRTRVSMQIYFSYGELCSWKRADAK